MGGEVVCGGFTLDDDDLFAVELDGVVYFFAFFGADVGDVFWDDFEGVKDVVAQVL